MDQVAQLVRSTLMGLAMVSFMHWKMGVKPVLVRGLGGLGDLFFGGKGRQQPTHSLLHTHNKQMMQSIMGPMNLLDNGLCKKYIMGSRDRVWGEALEG